VIAMTVLRRVLALVLAVGLLLAAVIAVVEVALAGLGRAPWIVPHDHWAGWLREQHWNSGPIRFALVVAFLIGLVVLVAGLHTGRPAALPLAGGSTGVTVTASRRSLERVLSAAAQDVDGVTTADVAAGRRVVRVQAWTRIRAADDLTGRVTAAVQDRLAALEPTRPPRLAVRVRTREGR
jgi:hypothetical protein